MKNIFKYNFSHTCSKPLIQINGTDELLADGCGEVKLYDEAKIVFKALKTVTVEGKGLFMTNLENGAVSIKGRIFSVRFED